MKKMNINIDLSNHNPEGNRISQQQQSPEHGQSSTQKENTTSYYDSEYETESKTETLSKSQSREAS